MKVKKILGYNDLLKSCDIALSSVIIRRSVLKKSFKFGHTKTKEDYFLWLKLSKILEIYVITKKLLYWRKTENSLSSNTLQKFYDAFIVYNQTENKNFLIIFFYVFRLSLNYVLKKIKQKIF